ncbi:MAG: restriction endonuclease subunit S [Thaumarchaeota archaeon]|nr:restriction endonuclease subunit S [Nitrososphaerota archaeon]
MGKKSNFKTKFKQTEAGKSMKPVMASEWFATTLGQLTDFVSGGTPSKENASYWNGSIPWVSAKDMKHFFLEDTEDHITEEGMRNGTKLVPENTVFLLTRGMTLLNDVPICIAHRPMAFNQDVKALRPKGGIDTRFLPYLLLGNKQHLLSLVDLAGHGTGRLNTDELKSLNVLLPTEPEQRAIAYILDTLDNKIELNRQMNRTLEAIGQVIFKQWFNDFEFPNEQGKPYKSSDGVMVYNEELRKEIPRGWKISTVGKEFKIVLGGTPSKAKKEYWENGDVPWINSGAINEFPVVQASKKITKIGLNNSAAELMPKRTVVLPFVISIGKEIRISILGIESSGNQSVLGIVENENIGAEYIYYYVQSIKHDVYSWATGGAQQHINKGNINRAKILLPDKDTQLKFNKILNSVFEQIINNSLENLNLEKIRDYLLPKLVSGKIRVPVEVR